MSATSFPITGLDGRIQLDPSALEAFGTDLDGALLRPDDVGYAESVSLWNGMIAKRPAIVARAASVDDVVRTVRFAAEHGIELSIRGGGHNIAGLALCDGGLTLDMSGRNQVEVDPEARRARVQAGALLGDVDRATQQHGLAATLGFVSLTGVAGLTLGGGFGYLTRRFGWTVDDLEEVEIVLADGSKYIAHHATRTQSCSGRFVAAVATSASSPSSPSASTRSGRRSPVDRSPGRPRRPSASSTPSGVSPSRRRASSRWWRSAAMPRPRRGCRSRRTARRSS